MTRETVLISFRDSALFWKGLDQFIEHLNPPISRSEFLRFLIRQALTGKLQDSSTIAKTTEKVEMHGTVDVESRDAGIGQLSQQGSTEDRAPQTKI